MTSRLMWSTSAASGTSANGPSAGPQGGEALLAEGADAARHAAYSVVELGQRLGGGARRRSSDS